MPSCIVLECKSRTSDKKSAQLVLEKKSQNITFHKFPADFERRQAWINAIGRKNWFPTIHSTVCSLHFTADCFDKSAFHTKLEKHSVPTLFPSISKYHKPVSRKMEINNVESSYPSIAILEAINNSKLKKFVSKGTSPCPEMRKIIISQLQQDIMRKYKSNLCAYQSKIKLLQQTLRRQSKKIAVLENTLKYLESKKSINEGIS